MEIGKVYKVEEIGFWMIGRVIEVGGKEKDGCYRGMATMINGQQIYQQNTEWCYESKGRTYREATQQEIAWLYLCIEKGHYVNKPKELGIEYEIY